MIIHRTLRFFPTAGLSRLPRLAAGLVVAVVVAAGLTACDQRLPEDPQAQIAEVRRRMDAVPTAHQKVTWLVHAADNPTTAARDLLLECLESPHLILSAAAAELLRVRWVRNAETRRLVRAYYLDPSRSLRNRETLYAFLIEKNRETYPEFADLTMPPPTFPGRVHIERPPPPKEPTP